MEKILDKNIGYQENNIWTTLESLGPKGCNPKLLINIRSKLDGADTFFLNFYF